MNYSNFISIHLRTIILTLIIIICSGCREEPKGPVENKPLTDIIAVNGEIALKNDGTVWSWGQAKLLEQEPETRSYKKYDKAITIGRSETEFIIPSIYTQASNVGGPKGKGYLNGITAIDGWIFYKIALNKDGTVWVWGENSSGVLACYYDTLRYSAVPIQIYELENIISISAGYLFALALRNDGTVWVWGSSHTIPCIPAEKNQSVYMPRPVQVPGLNNIIAIAAGGDHALALRNDGTVWAWGEGRNNELGDGTDSIKYLPIQVPGLENVISIFAGLATNIVIKMDGTVWGWGQGIDNHLEKDNKGDYYYKRATPVQLELNNVKKFSIGRRRIGVLKNDGTVWGWEWEHPDCHKPETGKWFAPAQVEGLNNIIDIFYNIVYGTIVLKQDGTVWQLWEDSILERKPVKKTLPTQIRQIYAR